MLLINSRHVTRLQSLMPAEDAPDVDADADADAAASQSGSTLAIGFTDLRGEAEAQVSRCSHSAECHAALRGSVKEADTSRNMRQPFPEIRFVSADREGLFITVPEGRSNLQKQSGDSLGDEGSEC